MTNEEIIQAIKNEIEKQRKFIEGMFIEGDNNFYDGQDDAYNNVLTFISTLESGTPMNQDEFSKEFDEYFLPKNREQKGQWGFADILSLARHFAQWGAEHLKK